MRSARPKALHPLGGYSLLSHALRTASAAGAGALAVVVGPDHDAVVEEARKFSTKAQIFEQSTRRGTAHAVLCARKAIARGADDILVIFADTPLVRDETLRRLRAEIGKGAAVAVLGFTPRDPNGYGRLVMNGTELVAIREERDANREERNIGFCNGGLMALSGKHALAILDQISAENAKNEFYLTDAVAIARKMGLNAVAIETSEDDVRGINTKGQLAEAEAVLQQRLRTAALEAGVTMTAPETVFLSSDTKLGRDVTIEPHVVFGPGVTVEEGATIKSFSYIEQSRVGKGARLGPFARLRPGADIGKNVHIGNFVEIKEATIEAGAKANHLSYIGNARVGEGTNVGAGTITCNYDGTSKFRTEIGKGAFIGSNTALVAPVKVGDGAYIGAGSVVTKNVPAGALAISRAKETIKEGWAKSLRQVKALGKKLPKKKSK